MNKISIILLAIFFLLINNLIGQIESEPNGSTALADTIFLVDNQGEINGALTPFQDEDYYIVELTQNGVLKATLTNVAQNIAPVVRFYDQNGFQIDVSSIAPNEGQSVVLQELVCSPGFYYIMIRDAAPQDQSDTLYNLSIILDTSDIYECNNTYSDAYNIAIGDTICARIHENGDEDYFSFEIGEPGVFYFQTIKIPTNIPMAAELSFNQTSLVIAQNSSNPGSPLIILYNICVPGIYNLKLYSSSSSNEEYGYFTYFDTTDMNECNNTIADATLVEKCDTITATILGIGDLDYYECNLVEGITYNANIENTSSDIGMSSIVSDEFGNLLSQLYVSNIGTSLNFDFTAPESKSYYFIVGSSNNFASFDPYFISLNHNCITTNTESINDLNVKIYPNPINEYLFIESNEPDLELVNIYDINGKLILQVEYKNYFSINQINLSFLVAGIYYIELKSPLKKIIERVVKF